MSIRRIEGEMPVRFRYTPGVGNGAFFDALRERGVLLGSRCGSCDVTYLPARIFCERCLAELRPDTECGPEGVVVSWTLARIDDDGAASPEPVRYALVRVDGADTVLVHLLLSDADVGDRVRVTLRAERAGSILDIAGFERA